MNTSALLFLLLSWGGITALFIFSYYRMFRGK